MILALIGLPGCGKTILGQALAEALDYPFADTDILAEAEAKMSVAQIFALYGETYFRDLETKQLNELCRRDKLVLSTGGGLVLRAENRKLLQNHCHVYYIRRSCDKIRETAQWANRPLLAQDPEGLYKLYETRRSFYENTAHRVIPGEGSLEEVLTLLLEVYYEDSGIKRP